MAELEYKIRIRVGNIYVWCGDCKKKIGEGYENLCQFVAFVNNGHVSPANIDTWLEAYSKKVAPDTAECTFDVHFLVSEEVFNSIHVTTEAVPYHVLPCQNCLKVMDAAILEEPERELPPYRSKLLAYDKRRNYSKKSYWNRIRSRLF